jgi:tetratricopeptide (TPR) repeat protein
MSATSWTRGLLVLGLGGVFAGCTAALLLSEKAIAETQQTGTPLSNPTTSTTQAGHVTKITPEQEAALVEVRKILREASEVAQAVVIENPDSKEGKFLVNNKRFALRDIVGAQARSGDIEGARMTTTANGWDKSWAIGIALAKAGRSHDGLKELSSQELDPPTRFVFIEALMKAGDRQTALEVAESRGTYLWQAPSIAYLATLQAKAGDLGYKETFQRALKVAEAFDRLDPPSKEPNIGKYKALVHIARAQVDAGDMTESRQTFVKALETALVVPERDQFNALLIIAEAQARSGDHAGSERTFGQAIKTAKALAPNQQLSGLKRIAEIQLEVGNRTAATETIRLLLQVPSGSSPRDQADGLMRQARWHLTLGDREAANSALQTVMPRVRTIADDPATPELERSNIYYGLAQLAAESGSFDLAQEAIQAITSNQTKANGIRQIITGLTSPSGRPEVQQFIQTLAKDATSLTGLLSFPRDLTLLDVAVIQAAIGDVKTAVQTADRVAEVLRDNAYREMAEVLIKNNNWSGAQEVLSRMKAEWMLNESSHHVFRALAKAQAKEGMGRQVVEWSQKQPDSVARANVFLGVAEGLMERIGIEQLRPAVPLFFHKQLSVVFLNGGNHVWSHYAIL